MVVYIVRVKKEIKGVFKEKEKAEKCYLSNRLYFDDYVDVDLIEEVLIE